MDHTAETEDTFRRDREAVDTMTDRGWTAEQKKRARSSMETRHAEYDARFALMVAQAKATDPARQPAVRRYLLALGDLGCRSGSYEFGEAVDRLEKLGITGANHVFEHDRRYVATTFLAAKVRQPA